MAMLHLSRVQPLIAACKSINVQLLTIVHAKPAGALGGRLDHTLSNLNTLYHFQHLDISLWGDGNLARLVCDFFTI